MRFFYMLESTNQPTKTYAQIKVCISKVFNCQWSLMIWLSLWNEMGEVVEGSATSPVFPKCFWLHEDAVISWLDSFSWTVQSAAQAPLLKRSLQRGSFLIASYRAPKESSLTGFGFVITPALRGISCLYIGATSTKTEAWAKGPVGFKSMQIRGFGACC